MGCVVRLVTGPFGAPRDIELNEAGQSICDVISGLKLAFRLPTIAVIDGMPVLRANWSMRRLAHGEQLAFITMPGGGGAGSTQGKQVAGVVAMLALAIAAPGIGGWAAAALQLTGTAASLVSAGTSLAVLPSSTILLHAISERLISP